MTIDIPSYIKWNNNLTAIMPTPTEKREKEDQRRFKLTEFIEGIQGHYVL